MMKKNEFKRDGTLRTKLQFTGIIKPQEVRTKTTKTYSIKGLEESEYWVLLDEHGARFLLFDETLALGTKICEPVEVTGKIGISKGGTYLVIERMEEFIPEDYITVEG